MNFSNEYISFTFFPFIFQDCEKNVSKIKNKKEFFTEVIKMFSYLQK